MGSRMRLSGLVTELLGIFAGVSAGPRRASWSKVGGAGGRGGGGGVSISNNIIRWEEEQLQQLARKDLSAPYITLGEDVKLRRELSRLSITNNLEVLRQRLLQGIGRRSQAQNSQENLVRLL